MAQRDSKHISGTEPALVPAKNRAPREAENSYRQVLRLEEMIRDAIEGERFNLKVSSLMELNKLAVHGLVESPGRYRLGDIEIEHSRHQPPHPDDVPRHVDDLCEYVNDHWDLEPLHLAAYTMWMLCWIHPFQDGNGRTARAASYLVLCARLGRSLPGERTIPVQLVDDKNPYYTALEAADDAYAKGEIDVQRLQDLLDELLVNQVRDAATSKLEQRDTVGRSGRRDAVLVRHDPSAPATNARQGMDGATKAALITGGAAVVAALVGLMKCSGVG